MPEKRHHSTSQMILKRFVDDSGRLFMFSKERPYKGVHQTSPVNALVESNLYSFLNREGTKNPTLEKEFSKFEGKAAPIIDKLIRQTRQRRDPQLTLREHRDLCRFVHSQWRRSPDFMKKFLVPYFDEHLAAAIRELERHAPIPKSEQDRLTDLPSRKRMQQNAWVEALKHKSPLVMQAIRAKGLGIVIIGNKSDSFITGSSPAAKLANPGAADLSHPEVELVMPVASDIAMFFSGPSGVRKVIELTNSEHVRQINLAILNGSDTVVGRSKSLLESLIGATETRSGHQAPSQTGADDAGAE